MERTFEIKTPDELELVAGEFLKKFDSPVVVLFEGRMGAGKTTFIKRICALKGIEGVDSPTFSLVNEYEDSKGNKIFHFDLYRLKSLEEALDFGFEEYLDQEAYVFIEWPEKIIPLLDEYHTVKIEDTGESRRITF